MAGEPPGPVEVEMALDVDGLDSRAPSLSLVGLELPAAIGRFIRKMATTGEMKPLSANARTCSSLKTLGMRFSGRILTMVPAL